MKNASMRTLRIIFALGLLTVLALPNGRTSIFAAHESVAEHDDDGAEHAANDLASTPISEIELRTAQNKGQVIRETGVEPGAARSTKVGASEPTFSAAAVSADPGQSGQWSSVFGTEVMPVFEAVLPNGKVLMWDSVGDNAAETYPDQSFTRAMVWDPTNNSFRRVDLQGYNIFCAGFAHLPNGNVLVAGGNANQALAGIVQTHIFDWQTETWTRGADMASGRWYPSVATMANGEHVIVGGGPAIAEVYQTNGAIRALTGFTNATYGGRAYPFMMSRPDTQLGLFGPYDAIYTLITSGNGAITGTGARDGKFRDYGSFATYDIGKSLVVGGGKLTEGGVANVPTKTAVVVNSNAGLVPTTTATGSMSTGRRQFNATVLADGSVLATGGLTSGAPNVDLNHAITSAERWDPATGAWKVLASASRIRQYHSTAALLPDGRVMTGGGGICGPCMDVGYLEKNIEYFTPPYLYKKDGSGQLAPRPVIQTAPTAIGVNTNFSVSFSGATSIQKVGLIGLSDVTHDVNQGQRYVPLRFQVSGTTLTVTGPPNSGVAPPGYYLLFITDSAGVPSVAKILQVAGGPTPLMSPVKNTGAGRCVDIPASALAIRTYTQTYACNNTKAQALTRLPNDNTLRVLGNCIDIPGSNFVSGQKIWTYTCNGTSAQAWQFGADGTIRPIAKTTLCLATASTANNAAISVATCNGSTLQKWTW
ncbi:MAG TPA: galactose oxidase-like domain-containing protein [Candidatus Saccharimonadia bacterium]|nr:galactose oxidase-like domain-containing protein [Candidatus Saccharimonadia bacterium]